MPLLEEMHLKSDVQKDLQKNYKEALKDAEFASLVKGLKLSMEEASKMTSKLQDSIVEYHRCQDCKGLFMCQNSYSGHVVVPEKKENKLYFFYRPCSFEQALEKKEKEQSITHTRMKDIDTTDKNQLKVIKWLDDFYENYDLTKTMKGLYLHGSFGSGKTYLLTALFNELKYTKNTSISIVYFPEMLRSLKEDWENFSIQMNYFMHVDVLLLDDIGAEKVTEWGRDEVLGTILQARMNANKTTFFTSNLTIEELEQHLSLVGSGVDKVKARRIIERIKQLTVDFLLVSENRRK